MKNKLFKVYAVKVNFPLKIRNTGLFAFGTETYDRWDTVAIFSTRKGAENCIGKGDFPFADEARGTRIDEWKIDYEIYWEEWNKLEAKK